MQKTILLFNQISVELQKQLQSIPQEAECLFWTRNVPIQVCENQLDSKDTGQKSQKNKILMIKGQYLLEIDLDKRTVLSGFKCDYQIKFQIIRSSKIGLKIMGKPIGLKFYFENEEDFQHISIYFQNNIIDCLQSKEKSKIDVFCQILQSKFMVQRGFHETFRAIKKIGKGVTASVFSAQRLTDDLEVAVKSFKKENYFKQDDGKGKIAFLNQFKIMTQIKSKYLCKLLGVYQSENSIYIVVQLLNRTFYKYLQKYNFPQPKLCKSILFKLLIGLKTLHVKKIMHRDLKLQNIMIRGQEKDGVQPVIIDFGLAEYTFNEKFIYTRCGTPGYAAPQIINMHNNDNQTKYDQSCDMFSLGVIFHILFLGKTVFEGEDMKTVVQKNRKCQIDYEFKQFAHIITPEGKNLLSGMLQKDPKLRKTVDQIIDHSFFQEQREIYKQQLEIFSDIKELQMKQKGQKKSAITE